MNLLKKIFKKENEYIDMNKLLELERESTEDDDEESKEEAIIEETEFKAREEE